MYPFILLYCILTTLISPGYAVEPQFREITLIDGRTFVAEIVSTESLGLSVRTPQGSALISFELLMDLKQVERDAYLSQPEMQVWVYAPERQEVVERLFDDIPNTAVMPLSDNAKAAACGSDFDCIQTTLASDQWYWIVYAAPPTDDRDAQLVFRSRTNTGSRVEVTDCPTLSPNDMWQKAHEAIGLISTKPRPVPGLTLGEPANARRLSLVPIPGYRSLQRGNVVGFATSMLVATVGTGAVTAIMMSQEMDGHTTGAVSTLSFYTLTVASNNLTTRRRNKRK